MKQFKNSLSVTGSKSLMRAFMHELDLLGYSCHYDDVDKRLNHVQRWHPHIWVNHDNLCDVFKSGKYTIADNIGEQIKTLLTLPADWSRALELAAEEVKEEFKVGDWALVQGYRHNIPTGNGFNGEIIAQLLELNRENNPVSGNLFEDSHFRVEVGGRFFSTNKKWVIRKATPSEIESHLIGEAEKKGFVKGAYIIAKSDKVRKCYSEDLTLQDSEWFQTLQGPIEELRITNNHEVLVRTRGNYTLYFELSSFDLKAPTPQISIGSHKVEFFDDHIQCGCKTISKDSILKLNAAIQQYNQKNPEANIHSLSIRAEAGIEISKLLTLANHFNEKP